MTCEEIIINHLKRYGTVSTDELIGEIEQKGATLLAREMTLKNLDRMVLERKIEEVSDDKWRGLWCHIGGCEFDDQERGSPRRDEGGDPICDECYIEHYQFTCSKCEDYEDNTHRDAIGCLVVVSERADIAPGIYEIISHPYWTSCYLDTWFNEDAIKQLSPDTFGIDTDPYAAGHLCRECAAQIRGLINEAEAVSS